MSRVSRETIEKCAENLMFELSPGQAEVIASEFDTLYAQLNFLSKVPGVDRTEPMTFPYRAHRSDTEMREDTPEETAGADWILSSSNSRLGDQVQVPKVVSHGEAGPDEEGE